MWCPDFTVRIERSTLDALDRVIVAAVGITTVALAQADRAGDLTFPQWRVLVVVGERPSGVRVSEIARRIGASSPSASRLIRRMERAGLVTTERDESDRRATLVRLTAAGARVRSTVIDHRRRLVARLFRSHAGQLPRDLDQGLQKIGDVLSTDP
jgi:DNA-binding MarR family transcriptional regulator